MSSLTLSGKSTEQQAWAKRGKTIRRGGAVQAAINDPVQYFKRFST